jgi:hypothetical protein
MRVSKGVPLQDEPYIDSVLGACIPLWARYWQLVLRGDLCHYSLVQASDTFALRIFPFLPPS